MERLKLLDALGFVWNAPRGAKRKRHIMANENEHNYIQDAMNQSRKVEGEVSDSIEANHDKESDWNNHLGNKTKCTSKSKENFYENGSQHSLDSPDANNIDQGMY
jgi:hypothetical protein